ncbi:hypothetical protein MIR68_010581 [Amoeboaphelidium protococcarum]|nr:hypothetical protein MIR68_010581 [Amoeboaphelidium protococcarum]
MTEYARKLLDTLMGVDRDDPVIRKRHFSEEAICKHYLVAFCPHDMFINTKSDLGYCTKVHDERLRKEFQQYVEQAKKNRDFKTEGPDGRSLYASQIMAFQKEYETSFFYYVRDILRDMERKLKRGQERLNAVGDEDANRQLMMAREERHERIIIAEFQIQQLQNKVEQLGDQGLVEEAKVADNEAEELMLVLHALRAEEAKDKKMDVCEVCGALLVQNDAPERIQAHNQGKQHLGFMKLRESYDSLRGKYDAERRQRYERLERERQQQNQQHQQYGRRPSHNYQRRHGGEYRDGYGYNQQAGGYSQQYANGYGNQARVQQYPQQGYQQQQQYAGQYQYY